MLVLDIFKTFILMGLCWMGYASSAWNLTLACLLTFSIGSAVVMFAVRRELAIHER